MKIYDISQEIFGCVVYSGDRAPSLKEDKRISYGDLYNLTSFEMCAHNGTHIDAPFHFLEDGDRIESIPLDKTVGYCYVTQQSEDIDSAAAQKILDFAKRRNVESAKRILIKGKGIVTAAAAKIFAQAGIYLVGVESQTVGTEEAPMEVHKILLNEKIVLLEGLRLAQIREDVYFLNAAPLLLNGCDGAPCRAILIATDE